MRVIEKHFISGSDRCVADLYLPESVDNPPVVIMAHGFAGERVFRLPAFAEKFCQQGMAVFLFDYRTFGASAGSPRQWVHPWRQLQDWRAAIAFVRTLPEVDGSKIALWGTSFSGGHVVSLAAEDHDIAAIIAQIPFVSGWNLIKIQSFKALLRLTVAAIQDFVGALFGSSPHEYPVVAHPGERGVMNTPNSYEGYLQLVPENSQWRNRIPARIGLYVPWYSPLSKAKNVRCPALIIGAANDNLIPVAAVKQMAEAIPDSEYAELQTDHFQPYVEPAFIENIAVQQQFLEKHYL